MNFNSFSSWGIKLLSKFLNLLTRSTKIAQPLRKYSGISRSPNSSHELRSVRGLSRNSRGNHLESLAATIKSCVAIWYAFSRTIGCIRIAWCIFSSCLYGAISRLELRQLNQISNFKWRIYSYFTGMLANLFFVTITWSRRWMPSISPAATSCSVTARSASLGSATPEG